MHDHDPFEDEAMVRSLRELLAPEERMPLGLRSRIEARVRREDARPDRLGGVSQAVLALLAFVVAAVADPSRWTPEALATLVGAATAYAIGLQALAGDADGAGPT